MGGKREPDERDDFGGRKPAQQRQEDEPELDLGEDRAPPKQGVTLGKVSSPPSPTAAAVLFFDGVQLYAKVPGGKLYSLLPFDAEQVTSANIAAVGHAVNTTGKFVGKIVFDTTNNRFMRASAATAAGAWRDLIGTNAVTPA